MSRKLSLYVGATGDAVGVEGLLVTMVSSRVEQAKREASFENSVGVKGVAYPKDNERSD